MGEGGGESRWYEWGLEREKIGEDGLDCRVGEGETAALGASNLLNRNSSCSDTKSSSECQWIIGHNTYLLVNQARLMRGNASTQGKEEMG
jgi:hypothetical protein